MGAQSGWMFYVAMTVADMAMTGTHHLLILPSRFSQLVPDSRESPGSQVREQFPRVGAGGGGGGGCSSAPGQGDQHFIVQFS